MEKRFMITGGKVAIPCKLYQPEDMPVSRCILGVHGIGGSKDVRILTALSEEMGLFGAATLRFDFPAHGDNVHTDRDLTLSNCRDTLLAAARWARNYCPDSELCVFSSGFGAYITLLCLEELENMTGHIRLVIQTPNVNMAEALLAMTRLTEAEFCARGSVTLPTHRKVTIPYGFYQELLRNPVYLPEAAPMLIIHGEKDHVVRLEDLMSFRRQNELAQLVVIPGADHQFRNDGAWDMVVDLTRDWFSCERVLLCDAL